MRIPRSVLYLIVLSAFGNTVLRPNVDSDVTLYRLLAPLALLLVFLAKPVMTIKYSLGYLIFALYGWMLAERYSGDLSQFIPSIIHYLYLFVLLLILVYMRRAYPDFERSFVRFFGGFYFFLCISLALEFIFGLTYPNLYTPENDLPALRAFYWNQNDVAVVLCGFAWLFLVDDRYTSSQRATLILLTAATLIYNDSKAALISLLFSVAIATVFILNNRFRIKPSVWIVISLFVFLFTLIPISVLLDQPIGFLSGEYSLNDLLYEPIKRIVTLETTGEFWGSLNNRIDAAISVLIEYFRSFGLGLGPGGSWLVLTLPQYELGGAKSPHNALLQFIVDFGFPVLVGYGYLVYWAVRRVFHRGLSYPTRLKVMAILSFPLLGLSQSGAIVTNFAFFALAVFIMLVGREGRRQVPIPAPSTVKENSLTEQAVEGVMSSR